jgi:hypothetical protein
LIAAWRLGNNFGRQAHLSRVEKLLDAVAWSGELEGHRSVGKMFLVDRILGPAIRAETATFVLADPAAGEARYFTGFAPPQTHGDRAVFKAQEWVHMRDGRGVSLAAMAVARRRDPTAKSLVAKASRQPISQR